MDSLMALIKYQQAFKALVKAVDHCRYMINIIKDSPGAKEPQTRVIIESIIVLLDNVRRGVAADLLRPESKD